MTTSRVRNAFHVLWQLMMLCATVCSASSVLAQQSDSTKRVTFPTVTTQAAGPIRPDRVIDMAISGGAGVYMQGAISPFQATAGADFSARTESLDFLVGFHWGFSHPSTKGLSIGLRFPLLESMTALNDGIYLDPSLLIFDNGGDSPAFQTGLRLAITGRAEPFEFRLAGEMRKSPISGGDRFEGWVGVEAGFFFDILSSGSIQPTRRDSLRVALRYIATSAELDALNDVRSNDEIDQWLNKFWRARAIDGTPASAARREYEHRIDLANQKYGTSHQMGVTTDMGRVLLVYGSPDRTEDVASIYGPQRRYELWIDEGRMEGYRTAVFLFVTTASQAFAGHGEYREVYSNIPGEPSEGIPGDLPAVMLNYINSFGR